MNPRDRSPILRAIDDMRRVDALPTNDDIRQVEGMPGGDGLRTTDEVGKVPAGDRVEVQMRELAAGIPDRIDADPEGAGRDLGRLVLTLVEFLRQALEHQAVRRFEAGSLTEEEEERLGLALSRLHEQVGELRDVFGLSDEDLNVDLGPLGRLL